MGRKRKSRFCADCGESLLYVFSGKYCNACRKRRYALGALVTTRRKVKKDDQFCTDCGKQIDIYTRSGLCKSCAAKRWRRRSNVDRTMAMVREKFGWWYEGPPPTGRAICIDRRER